jgi:lysophospholipase L1-like esterase
MSLAGVDRVLLKRTHVFPQGTRNSTARHNDYSCWSEQALSYAFSWLAEMPMVLSEDGAGFLSYLSPLGLYATIAMASFVEAPFLSAFIMTGIAEGKQGVGRLLRQLVLWRVSFKWYLFALIGLPAIMVLSVIFLPGALASFQGLAGPAPLPSLVLFVYIFFLGGPLGEEPRWRGFALPRLQRLCGPLVGSLILGPYSFRAGIPEGLLQLQKPEMSILKIIVFCVLLCGCSVLDAKPYSGLFVIGDSMSDTGTNRAGQTDPALYWMDHSSNGQMWPEVLSSLLHVPFRSACNQATSGATTSDLMIQLSRLPKGSATSLYVLWMGHNDLLYGYATGQLEQFKSQSLSNLGKGIKAIYDRGGRFVLVPKLFDLTTTPAFQKEESAENIAIFRANLIDYNTRLDAVIQRHRRKHKGLTIFTIDTFAKLNDLLSNASIYGITEPYGIGWDDPEFITAGNWLFGNKYASWDGVHPTSAIHQQLALWFYLAVTSSSLR